MSREHATGGVSPEKLSPHAINEIFAPVTATRYDVCDQAIRGAINAIAREHPRVVASFGLEQHMPPTAAVAPEPAIAATVAVSAVAEVQPEFAAASGAADAGDNLAVGGLAHAAYRPAVEENPAEAARVLAAFQRSGYMHANAIDNRELRAQDSMPEGPSVTEELSYVSGLRAAVDSPGHLPGYEPAAPLTVESAQASVVQAFPMPAAHVDLRPTYPADQRAA